MSRSDEGPDPPLDVENHYRRRLYRILSDPSASPAELLDQLLALGRERLDVENGHLVAVEPDARRHEVVAASGSNAVQPGDVTDLDETFCRETVTQDRILAFSDAREDGWTDDPAYERWGLHCYIGSRIEVRNELYGTLCFVDGDPRETSFSGTDRGFVDVLARSVSQVLERDRYERDLRVAEDHLELLVEEVSDYAIFLLDPSGRVATWNRGARLTKGYAEDDVVGEHFARFYPEEQRREGRPAQLLERARREGRVEDEGWRVRADGSRFWALVTITALYDDDGELRGFGKVTRDLTERRAHQERLEAEQAFTERALDTLEDLFFVMDDEGQLERVNERVEAVTGYTETELRSMDPSALFVSADQHRIEAAIEDALTTGEVTVEATLVTGDEERRQYEFRTRRLTGADGTVGGLVGIGRDITDRRLYEERLEVTQRVLRHNLRNELNVVRGAAESLAESVDDDQRPMVDRIVETADDLLELTEKSRLLVEMESLSDDAGAHVDMADRLRSILESFRERHPEADVDCEAPDSLEVRIGAPDRFEVALRNAAENAVEHDPASEPSVTVSLERDSGQVLVEVVDEAPTIPVSERQVLEEGGEGPLRHGSGLGLWLMHWCATTVGGDVAFDERPDGGNRITLRFPTRGS